MDYKTIMAEFEAGFKGKEDVDSVSAKKKHFLGVSKKGNRWQARIRNPKLKTEVYLGSYRTPEEAALVVQKKKAEFEEEFKSKEDVNSVPAKRKHLLGVSKKGNRWQARIQNPKLKAQAYLGYYSTPEEAALVVKKKKAEFKEMLNGEDGLRTKRRCGNEFRGRKLPCGVRSQRGKFRVRVWHPGLKKFASFGYYSTCDEAAVVADRKRAELRELYGGKPRGSSECEDNVKVLQETESLEAAVVADRKRKRKRAELSEVYGGKVRGSGECEDDDEEVLQETMSENGGKFECSDEQASDVKVPARIKDSVSNDRIWLGTYDTLADAIRCYRKEKTVLDTKMKRAEFEEQFMGKEDVNIVEDETCDGVSAKRTHFLGVSKKGNKWQARIRHPKLKVRVHLGCYSTPEEAALVVKTKKAEFEEMFKAEDGLREKRCVHEFEGRKLPSGVAREHGKFRVRLWHPGLKKYASFGYYNTSEEAVVVADRKRAELGEVYGEKSRGRGEDEDDDEVLQECGSEVAGEVECSDVQTRDVKVPAGVRRVRSGKRVARIKDLASSDRIWLGTYDTPEEFIKCYYNKKIAFQMGSDGLNNFEMSDKLNCEVVDVPDKLECQFVQGSRTSNIELGTSNSARVGDKRVIDRMSQRKTTCSFDEAVSAGFINEYGQLVGKYRQLDEQLWWGLPDEYVAASG